MLARSTANAGEEPPWAYWFGEAHIVGTTGDVELAVGNYHEAEPLLRRAVGLCGAEFTRDRSWYLCGLAKARLGAGFVEQACATASEAGTVIRKLNSTRDRLLLAEVRQAMTPHAQASAVRDFYDRHGDLLASTTPDHATG